MEIVKPSQKGELVLDDSTKYSIDEIKKMSKADKVFLSLDVRGLYLQLNIILRL